MHDQDIKFMRRALELAAKAKGQTRPNPLVGAVIVRDGRIIGEGFHQRAGMPHAEREALAACTESPRGSTLYVTLEPCNHQGRTPPCTDAVLENGIARVVIAQRDPNPAAHGGTQRLFAAGVEVETGVCEQEALLLNPGFNTYHLLGRPFVTLKWAMSADGCTSTASAQSAWITSSASRRRGHQMRAESDAVLVGVETAMRDNTRLTIRAVEVPPGPPLMRIVLDPALRLSPAHPFLHQENGGAIIVCADDASPENEKAIADTGATVWRIQRRETDQKLDLHELLDRLHKCGAQKLYIEGGRRVSGLFLHAKLVDRIAAFIAPAIIGCGHDPLSAVLSPEPITNMEEAIRLHHAQWETIGDDALLQAWVSHHLFIK